MNTTFCCYDVHFFFCCCHHNWVQKPFNDDTKIVKITPFPSQCERALTEFVVSETQCEQVTCTINILVYVKQCLLMRQWAIHSMYVHFQQIRNLLCSYYHTRLNERYSQCRRPLITDDINGCVNTIDIALTAMCLSQGGCATYYFPLPQGGLHLTVRSRWPNPIQIFL